MSAAQMSTDHKKEIDDVHECNNEEGHSIELEESEYPLIFTDKKGLAMISFVTIGLAYGFNEIYPHLKDEN
jgi:hypothetical protein